MKKILLILAAVMLIMSVCVVASAAGQSVTYQSATHPGVAVFANDSVGNDIGALDRGMADGSTVLFPTDVPEGEYIVTANVATNMEGNKMRAYVESGDTPIFDMPLAAGEIDVPNTNWTKFTDITFGIAKITKVRNKIGLNIIISQSGTWIRIKSITLRPVDDFEQKTVTIMGTPAQREGVGGGTNNLMELGDIVPGDYMLSVKLATQTAEENASQATIEIYTTNKINEFTGENCKYKDIKIPKKGWTTFSDVHVGKLTITENHNYLYVIVRTADARIASATLIPVATYNSSNAGADRLQFYPNEALQGHASYAAWMANGISTKKVYLTADVPSGRYDVYVKTAINAETDNTTITASTCSGIGQNLTNFATDFKVPYVGGWGSFKVVKVGTATITDTHKMILLDIKGMLRMSDIILVPIDAITPTAHIIQGTKDGIATATARVTVDRIYDDKAYTPLAAYYENNELVSVKNLAASSSYVNEYSVTFNDVKAGTNNYVKVFVWDNLENCYPYIEAVTAPIVQ